MRVRQREEPILLRIRAGKRERTGGAERLHNSAVVPEPATGNFILAIAHDAVVADRVLVVLDRGDTGKTASEGASRTGGGPATIESGSWN